MFAIYNKLPPKLKERIKSILNASGHSQSTLNLFKAHHHARNSKNLELSLTEITNTLKACNINSIEGLSCMDFGAGYVLTDSLALYILGASSVYAIDYTDLFRQSAFISLIKNSNFEKILKIAHPHCNEKKLKSRISKINNLNKKNSMIKDLNIYYVAPFDYSRKKIMNKIDLIHSTSVFEHIPQDQIIPILNNLSLSLSRNGKIITKIHMEDHRDFKHNPFDFFAHETDYKYEVDCDSRGNRLLISDWKNIFDKIKLLDTNLAYKKSRKDLIEIKALDKMYEKIPPEELYISNAWFISSINHK